MPNPQQLKVGDRVRFVSMPDEWRNSENIVPRESVAIMEVMIARSWPSRVYEVDEHATPWVAARIRKHRRIQLGYHGTHWLAPRETKIGLDLQLGQTSAWRVRQHADIGRTEVKGCMVIRTGRTVLMRSCLCLLFAFFLAGLGVGSIGTAEEGGGLRSRTFRFDYGAMLTELPPASSVRVWLPVPETSAHQKISPIASRLPAPATRNKEARYGNSILFFETKAPANGSVSFSTSYQVTRFEIRGLERSPGNQLTVAERRKFLASNRKVPVTGRPLELLTGVTLPDNVLARSRVIYDRVDDHVRYDKSQPGYGNGDVLWVCDSRLGNCTDFHSLFISLARAQDIPARFEIGFSLLPNRGTGTIGGYHCWAFFHTEDRGWVPVDISEADKHPEMKEYYFGSLTEDRVTFSVGRDLHLVPPQKGPPLNYFVYPYVEVNGETLPNEHIELSLAYLDQ